MGLMDFLGQNNEFQANNNVLQYQARNYYRDATDKYDGQGNAITGRQNSFLNALSAQAAGGGPSVANQMAINAGQQATQMAAAQAASARGDLNPAMLARNAMNTAAGAAGAANQNAAAMRQQEMLTANQLYGQNIAQAQNNATSNNQFFNNLGMQGDSANLGSVNQAQAINANVAEGNAGRNAAAVGGLISGSASAIGMASDERLKTDVRSGDSDIESFLDALSAKKFRYKDEKFGKGEFVSPMAQDLEKTPIGDSMVEDTAEGKMVDYGKGFGAVLAALAHLNERLPKGKS